MLPMGAWPEAATCQLIAVISLLWTFILHLPERQLTTWHQQVKCAVDYSPVTVERLSTGQFPQSNECVTGHASA